MEKITEILSNLEQENNIKIIFAVEAGSRAWGLDSEDSDYDIRFVYFNKNTRSYLSLKQQKETLDGFSPDRLYDWQGWDITKALKLLHGMNPSIVEWVHSPIVYLNDTSSCDFPLEAKQILDKQKRIAPLLFHYRSMAKSNYKDHIENKTTVNLKKYLYVIRPAGMVIWLCNCKTDSKLLELDFNKVLEEIKPHLSEECYNKIVEIIKVKKSKKESDEGERIKSVDQWIESVLKLFNDKFKENSPAQNYDDYDAILHSILRIKFNNE